jgi:hypothetical protein
MITPMSISKSTPSSMIVGMPKVREKPARNRPFSMKRSPITWVMAFRLVIMMKRLIRMTAMDI